MTFLELHRKLSAQVINHPPPPPTFPFLLFSPHPFFLTHLHSPLLISTACSQESLCCSLVSAGSGGRGRKPTWPQHPLTGLCYKPYHFNVTFIYIFFPFLPHLPLFLSSPSLYSLPPSLPPSFLPSLQSSLLLNAAGLSSSVLLSLGHPLSHRTGATPASSLHNSSW